MNRYLRYTSFPYHVLHFLMAFRHLNSFILHSNIVTTQLYNFDMRQFMIVATISISQLMGHMHGAYELELCVIL